MQLAFDGQQILISLIVFVVAITIHEFMHAYTAYLLGDTTAAREGRVTLNPVAHFDPLGFLMLLVLLVVGIGIAWGRPVPVNPGNFRNPKRGMLLTAAAGPLSNLVVATLVAIPARLFGAQLSGWPLQLIKTAILLNILLVAFNLIPIPPLDGHKILTGILPDFWYPILAPLERFGFAFLLLALFLPQYIGLNLIGMISGPVQSILGRLLYPF